MKNAKSEKERERIVEEMQRRLAQIEDEQVRERQE